MDMAIRSDEPKQWTRAALRTVHELPIMDLLWRAHTVHRVYHDPNAVQQCTLISIKTGGCPEDCAYCPQSAHYETPIDREGLLAVEDVLAAAHTARDGGSTRFCMGAAWREVRDGGDFDSVLAMVRGVRALGMEACCTLGMLTDAQAQQLAEAGLTAYNHNLDTGPDFYREIIRTRAYQDRLDTIARVQAVGIGVCSGGIIGMGESLDDRLDMIAVLAAMDPPPASVPINALVPVEGTPLAEQQPVDPIAFVRMIATARIALPQSMVRLSAGRLSLSDEAQTLCFFAGANSIFAGEKLLTTPNPERDRDTMLFEKLGLTALRDERPDQP